MVQRTMLLRIISVIGVALVVMMGCELVEQSVNAPTAPGERDSSALTNYIVGTAEDDDWAAYYNPGDPYFKVTIPIIGAVKIEYFITKGVQIGQTFTVVLKTHLPTTHEIGLNTFEVDGQSVTDVVDCVTVTYVESGDFVQKPANVSERTGKEYIQYQRQTADGKTEPWWSATEAAAFVFSDGEQKVLRPYCQERLLVKEGQPALRPVLAAWCKPPAKMYGFNWYYVTGGQSCTSACKACGSVVDPAGLKYFVGNADAANQCAALIPAVLGAGGAGGLIDNNPPTAVFGAGGPNGCHDYTNDPPAGNIWVSDTNVQNPNWVINKGEGMFCPCL